MPPLTVPIAEFCRAIGIKRSLAFELIRRGEVDVVRIKRRTLVTTDSIERLIERNIVRGRS